jgi:cytochrome bd-type quinol oxidase subunit 2
MAAPATTRAQSTDAFQIVKLILEANGPRSLVAAFMQGLTVGALVASLPIVDGRYSGGDFGWLAPFSILCGVGLCVGYALLRASWLVRKCDGDVRASAFRLSFRFCLSRCSCSSLWCSGLRLLKIFGL